MNPHHKHGSVDCSRGEPVEFLPLPPVRSQRLGSGGTQMRPQIIDPGKKTRSVTFGSFFSYRATAGKTSSAISHSNLGGVLRYLAGVYPGWYLGWYMDHTRPYLGAILGRRILLPYHGYPGPYPAPYPAVSWPYLGRILQLDVGAENMVVGMALASFIQITNKPFGTLL